VLIAYILEPSESGFLTHVEQSAYPPDRSLTVLPPNNYFAWTNASADEFMRAVTSASLSTTFTVYQHLRYRLSPSRAMQSRDIPLERVCLLDPKAPLTPTPSDGDAAKFTWFFFDVRHRPFLLSLFLLSSFTVFSFYYRT
jgi:hypothetical protein